jgi:hypothetical protein
VTPEQIDEFWGQVENLPDAGIKAELLGLVREAVAAEREACARVAFAEEFAGDTPGCCRITASLIGGAIRTREEP